MNSILMAIIGLGHANQHLIVLTNSLGLAHKYLCMVIISLCPANKSIWKESISGTFLYKMMTTQRQLPNNSPDLVRPLDHA